MSETAATAGGRAYREDSMPVGKATTTSEGYLRDRPVLTSIGIFEYTNPDGSPRRELRLPEEVFDRESLASYKGKPIIITHDAGLVSKDNVQENQIGTILSEGARDGDDVRAEIIIHDTDAMRESGLKELSLGYSLDLDETPGEWRGEKYDAVQRNIRINHLALVREARAGDQARLNIDGRGGGKRGERMGMDRYGRVRNDGLLTPEELDKAIKEYRARRASEGSGAKGDSAPLGRGEEKSQGDCGGKGKKAQGDCGGKAKGAKADAEGGADPKKATGKGGEIESELDELKQNQANMDADGDPEDMDEARDVIARQDEDISTLFDIIDTLLAQSDFDRDGKGADCGPGGCGPDGRKDAGAADDPDAEAQADADDGEEGGWPPRKDGDDPDSIAQGDADGDPELPEEPEEAPRKNKDGGKGCGTVNADGVDRIVRDRIKIGVAASILGMDGLEGVKIAPAKRTIIRAARPNIRLDGKSDAYVDAMFDMVCDELRAGSRKDADYQRRQMSAGASARMDSDDSSTAARRRMIERLQNRNAGKEEGR